jgi:hypothetical protein
MSRRMLETLMLGAMVLACQNGTPPPSADDVARRLPEFYLQAPPMTGLYLNQDTDGIIFRYRVPENERAVWLQRLTDTARANGWEVIHEDESRSVRSVHFRRIDDPRRRYRDLHSLELVRTISCGNVILVGGVQADLKALNEPAVVFTDGPDWYRTTFWPLLAEYQAEVCQRPVP